MSQHSISMSTAPNRSRVTVTDGDGWCLRVSVTSLDSTDPDGKPQYLWRVAELGAGVSVQGDDLYGPAGSPHNAETMLPAVLTFLAADGERYAAAKDDPSYLFGVVVAEAAYMLRDALQDAECELDPSERV